MMIAIAIAQAIATKKKTTNNQEAKNKAPRSLPKEQYHIEPGCLFCRRLPLAEHRPQSHFIARLKLLGAWAIPSR